MKIETAIIRQFLRKRFNDEKLDILPLDYFSDIQQDLTLYMIKGLKIGNRCRSYRLTFR